MITRIPTGLFALRLMSAGTFRKVGKRSMRIGEGSGAMGGVGGGQRGR